MNEKIKDIENLVSCFQQLQAMQDDDNELKDNPLVKEYLDLMLATYNQ